MPKSYRNLKISVQAEDTTQISRLLLSVSIKENGTLHTGWKQIANTLLKERLHDNDILKSKREGESQRPLKKKVSGPNGNQSNHSGPSEYFNTVIVLPLKRLPRTKQGNQQKLLS